MKEEEFREVLQKLFGEVDEKVVQNYLETRKHVKEGKNKVEVTFEGPAFSDQEVEVLNHLFDRQQSQFSYIDESKVIKNHFDYQDIIATVFIGDDIYAILKNAIVYPAIWELIKLVTQKVFARKDKVKVKVKKKTVCIYVNCNDCIHGCRKRSKI